jgi:hypothetical protein
MVVLPTSNSIQTSMYLLNRTKYSPFLMMLMKYQKIWLIVSTHNNDASFKSKVVYARVNMAKENNENMQGQGQQQSPSQWTQMIGQALESVTGKNMSTTIEFQDLEIDIPKAQGPDGRDLGSAKWTVNGKVVWTTELHKTGESS